MGLSHPTLFVEISVFSVKTHRMKVYKAFFVLIFLFLFFACKKETPCTSPGGLHGKWVWEKSIGGLGSWTWTPKTEKRSQSLILDEFFYREYREDSLFFESRYQVEVRPDSFFNANKYLIFENGGERAYWYDDKHLEVHELCFDCFTHYYRRD